MLLSPQSSKRDAPRSSLHAVLLVDSEVRVWGMTSEQRLRRQLRAAGLADVSDNTTAPAAGRLLLIRRDWFFDQPIIQALAAAGDELVLFDADNREAVAAVVDAARRDQVMACLLGGECPDFLRRVTPATLATAYNRKLRKREPPYLMKLSAGSVDAIEKRSFAGSYKGVTDLVTKHVWPWPARHVTRWCAQLGITPNSVTFASFLLTIATYVLFAKGIYGWGFVAAWAMTFLDTVDGKLARVTLQSSKFGDIFDHGIDLLHPPFWWWAWIVGLEAIGQPLPHADWVFGIILVGYVAQRVEEGLFHALFGMAMHVWRPFDSLFRQITARRNPNLLILMIATLCGAPVLGIQLVAVWVAVCLLIHALRIGQAAWTRRRGPLVSWLDS